MEYLLDTGNLEIIRKYNEVLPVTGVTSNPSILKAEGRIPFFERLKEIRNVIGAEKSLHVQVTRMDCEGMLREADAILSKVDDRVFIKIPTTEQGLKAMQILKAGGTGVTATAIYTRTQGLMAIAAKADFIAPYCNRMAALDIDFRETIALLRQAINENNAATKILAASFHSIEQVNSAFAAGAQAVTVAPDLLLPALQTACVSSALDTFADDWKAVHGDAAIFDL